MSKYAFVANAYALQETCTMVTVKIKGTACSLYNVYTVVTASHGIAAWLWYIREVIPWVAIYKVLVYIVQATYTIALSWFIELHARGAVFKPLGFASWFKHPPLAYNSNKPL